MKKKLLGVLLLILAAACIYGSAKEGSRNALIGGAAAALVCAFFAFRFFRNAGGAKQSAPAAMQRPAAAPAPRKAAQNSRYQFVDFSVAGVTFQNDDGSDRQTILRHLKFMDPPYVPQGQTNAEVELRPYTYKGSPAVYCIVNGYTIGSVPAAKVQDVLDALKHGDATVSGFTITGGNGYNYGCDIAVRYTP